MVPGRPGKLPRGRESVAAPPGGIEKLYLRGDSALYAHKLRRRLNRQAISYTISGDMSSQLADCIAAARRTLEPRPAGGCGPRTAANPLRPQTSALAWV